jgi:hypothetical protein
MNLEVINMPAMPKNQMLAINMLKYGSRIPIEYLKMTKFKTIVLHNDAIIVFKNLKTLKLVDVLIPT